MGHTYRKLLKLLEHKLNRPLFIGYFEVQIWKQFKTRIQEMHQLFDPIFEIITNGFTKREIRTLTGPYLFPFDQNGRFLYGEDILLQIKEMKEMIIEYIKTLEPTEVVTKLDPAFHHYIQGEIKPELKSGEISHE